MYQKERLACVTETLEQVRLALGEFRKGMDDHAKRIEQFQQAVSLAPSGIAVIENLRLDAFEASAACAEMHTTLALVCAELEACRAEAA